jgi:branched-chain amino acid transport system substrate-binding protein
MLGRSVRRAAAVLGALLLTVALSGTSTRAADAPPSVDIPVVVPLTGGAAFLGQTMEAGLHLLEQRVNGSGGIRNRPLHFVFLDDQGQPQLAVQIINQVIAQHPPIILGGALGATCKSVMPLVEQAGPVLYCLSPAVVPTPGSYVFSAGVYPGDEVRAAFRFFRDRGWTRIAFLTSTDASGEEADGNIVRESQAPENRALQVVAHERFNPNDINAAAQVARIKAANAQAMILWAGPGALAAAFHSINDDGLDIPVLVSDSIMSYSIMDQFATFLPKQLYFASSSWAGASVLPPGAQRTNNQSVYAAFRSANVPTDTGPTQPWDAAVIAVDALRKVGPDASARAVRDAIEQLHGYPGIMGTYDFRTSDQRGLTVKDVMIYRWLKDQRVWQPASLGGGALLKRN